MTGAGGKLVPRRRKVPRGALVGAVWVALLKQRQGPYGELLQDQLRPRLGLRPWLAFFFRAFFFLRWVR